VRVAKCNRLGECDYDDVHLDFRFTDIAAPVPILTGGPAGTVENAVGDQTFTFMSDDPLATFDCRLDQGAFTACASPVKLYGLGHGQHEFEVRAKDPSLLASSVTRVWVEEIAPDTRIIDGPVDGASVRDRSATLVIASTKDDPTFECQLDGQDFRPCATTTVFTSLEEGRHEFTARAIRLGERDRTPATRSWTVDLTPPDTVIESGPDDGLLTNARSATLVFGSESGANFECALDDAAFGPCLPQLSLGDLPIGKRTFRVRAVDAAGNADATPAARSWTITADLDRDGFAIGDQDCDDSDPNVRLGAREILDDGIDQDCDGVDQKDLDRDRDGFLVGVQDCDDSDPSVHRGAQDIPRNRKDEDCERGDAPFDEVPSRIAISYRGTPAGLRVKQLVVRRVLADATIQLRCTGRGCPFKIKTFTIRKARARISLHRHFKGRVLRPRAVIEVRVTAPERLGRVRRYSVTPSAPPDIVIRSLCLDPRTTKQPVGSVDRRQRPRPPRRSEDCS